MAKKEIYYSIAKDVRSDMRKLMETANVDFKLKRHLLTIMELTILEDGPVSRDSVIKALNSHNKQTTDTTKK